jgi:hypothetical protein
MNKKWAAKRITVNLTSMEANALEEFCARTGRPSTDVIRELVRSLSGDASLGTLSRQIQM